MQQHVDLKRPTLPDQDQPEASALRAQDGHKNLAPFVIAGQSFAEGIPGIQPSPEPRTHTSTSWPTYTTSPSSSSTSTPSPT
eukprot:1055913-Heterocapsa_arctica.AAC.2